MTTINDVVTMCSDRDGCNGCPFAFHPRECEFCGQEIVVYCSPLCSAEVDGLEPYLWPLEQEDLFTQPEFVVRNRKEIEQVLRSYKGSKSA